MSMDFDDLDGGRTTNDYDFDDFETVDLEDAGDALVGRLESVVENVGQYDSTVYLVENDDGQKMLFGNASIDAGFDNSDAEAGDMIGIRRTGETYENKHGEFAQYEVRFQKADE